ncbi:MAG TPA: nicotinate (nicotinamide) nucleotide adenylyltransferase [Bacteroidales bacterium]|nr:nicotinate (nicotinamide) nucleotide adenylyltransferase [Bacteroidales bacterium]HPT51704.1 nicotinate (nicotinamide) nucleotide adenylyltransferase [Bacteroidales bacterium]
MQKIGLFFGSFNPIHIGHLIMAEYFIENTDLKEIWFVVSPNNPLKKKDTLLNASQRLYMVNIAIEDDPRFRSCDIEFKLPYPSYTCNTLVHLQENYPDKTFVLMMGEDNLENIEKWKNYEFILNNYSIYTYPRMSYDCGEHKNLPNVTFVPAPRIEISATLIRNSIAQKKSVKYLLPTKVEQFIDDMQLYQLKK